jgi:hypothetical protein
VGLDELVREKKKKWTKREIEKKGIGEDIWMNSDTMILLVTAVSTILSLPISDLSWYIH